MLRQLAGERPGVQILEGGTAISAVLTVDDK